MRIGVLWAGLWVAMWLTHVGGTDMRLSKRQPFGDASVSGASSSIGRQRVNFLKTARARQNKLKHS